MTKTLFIAGIPGTGKTEIGDYLADNYDFFHLNMENPPSNLQNLIISGNFKAIEQAIPDEKRLVITWGFLPDNQNVLALVEKIIDLNPKYVWFDGNREAARKAFLRRNTVQEDLLDIQLERIERTGISQKWSPTIFNTFDTEGNFLSKNHISEKLIELLENGNNNNGSKK